jgi:hypothetical protein
MPKKLTHCEVKIYIESKGDILINDEYDNNKKLLDIVCGACNKNYNQTFDRFKRGYQHPKCSTGLQFGGYKKPIILKPIICVMCKIEFKPKKSKTKLCSRKCAHNLSRTDEYIKRSVLHGRMTAAQQCKRGKNEIYFSELCAKEFEITTNEPFFDGWDADVIIHSEKTAILWNGIWHYKQLAKTQSLKQIQARDMVKTAIIKKYGYIPYVIKDMGRYDKGFVDQEFEIFKFMRINV